jgi:hypothetical protein
MTPIVIQNLADEGYDITSYFATARLVNERFASREVSKSNIYGIMDKLFGAHVELDNDVAANITLRYMIAESVKLHTNGDVVDVGLLTNMAKEKTKQFFVDQPWSDPSRHSEIGDIPGAVQMTDVAVEDIMISRTKVGIQVIKPKKGLKIEATRRIYEANRGAENSVIIGLLMAQLDMSKTGATTYLYNVRKSFGDVAEGAKKGRKAKAE